MSEQHATCVAIRSASTQAEVIAQVRKYLASLEPSKAALIPPTLLAVGIDHAREIAQGAIELASRELTAVDEHTAEFLRDAATVLSTAAMRLAVLSMDSQTESG